MYTMSSFLKPIRAWPIPPPAIHLPQLTMAGLGRPVVPEVKTSMAISVYDFCERSSSGTLRGSAADAWISTSGVKRRQVTPSSSWRTSSSKLEATLTSMMHNFASEALMQWIRGLLCRL